MTATFLELQDELRRRSRSGELDEDLDQLRRKTACALDDLQRSGVQVAADQVDVRLIRPPWSSRKALRAASGSASDFMHSVTESRAKLIARRPLAANLLSYLDMRSEAMEPYRRLGEARHLSWASASVAATVAAVERVRAAQSRQAIESCAPRVLIAEGSLGAEAAAAAAAGARVWVCEPNRFCASAIREVADSHQVGSLVTIVPTTAEQWLQPHGEKGAENASEAGCDVVVLSPLMEEAGLGKRLLPAAAAAAGFAAASTSSSSVGAHKRTDSPLVVPARLNMHGALALLTAGNVRGVDLTPLDTTRWSPYPMPWAAEQEEGAVRLSAFELLVGFDLTRGYAAMGGSHEGGPKDSRSSVAHRPAGFTCESMSGCERRVAFHVTRNLIAIANRATGGEGGAEWARCNALILDASPGFEIMVGAGRRHPESEEAAHDNAVAEEVAQEAAPESTSAFASLPPPPKRAVHFVEPFVVRAGQTIVLTVRHDGHRLSVASPIVCTTAPAAIPATPSHPSTSKPSAAPWGAEDGWGRLLLQHWHFAMVRDMPRNDAYADAIARVSALVTTRAEAAAQEALRQGGRRRENLCAIDLGSGSGLLALMLAQAIDKDSVGKDSGSEGAGGRLISHPTVLGVEIVAGVAELGRKVIDHNGRSASCSLIRAEGHALCAQVAQRPSSERPKVPMLVAELMDSGGLGEGQINYCAHSDSPALIPKLI